jgi:hypothetical protein
MDSSHSLIIGSADDKSVYTLIILLQSTTYLTRSAGSLTEGSSEKRCRERGKQNISELWKCPCNYFEVNDFFT